MGGPIRFGVVDGLSWAINKFSRNALALILATAVFAVVSSVIRLIAQKVVATFGPAWTRAETSDATELASRMSAGAGVAFTLTLWVVLTVVSGLMASAYLGGFLVIADGRQAKFRSFFRLRSFGTVAGTSFLGVVVVFLSVVLARLLLRLAFFGIGPIAPLVVALMFALGPIGFAMPYLVTSLPSVMFSLVGLVAVLAVVDRSVSPVNGVKMALRLARGNFGSLAVSVLLGLVATAVSVLTGGIGLLVALPVWLLLVVAIYRAHSGGPLAPATP